MLDRLEVALLQAHQGGAVEGRVAPDPVVGVGRERPARPVEPLLLGAVAVLDEHGARAPVLGLARQVLAALQDQDRLAGGGEALGDGRAPGAAADDHHVEVRHPPQPSR